MPIAEADWRRLSKLKPLALDRLCERILSDLRALASDANDNHHERYGKVYGLIQEQDKLIARIFDGLSRSNALWKLAAMVEEKLITGEEFRLFSEETRASITDRVG